MESVYSGLMRRQPLLLFLLLRSNPLVFLLVLLLVSLYNDEAALPLSPRIITCDGRTDSGGIIFSLIFFQDAASLPGFVSGCCSPPFLSRHVSTPSLSDELNGFSAVQGKAEGFFTLFGVGGNWFPMALFLNLFQLMLVLGTNSELYRRPIETAV